MERYKVVRKNSIEFYDSDMFCAAVTAGFNVGDVIKREVDGEPVDIVVIGPGSVSVKKGENVFIRIPEEGDQNEESFYEENENKKN